MVTLCPLFVVTVAAAIVTTIWPVTMTEDDCGSITGVARSEVIIEPAGGELYISQRPAED